MENDKRNIGRDPHIAPGVYYIQKELCARIDGDRIIVEKKESEDERIRKELIGGLMWQRDNLNANGRHDDNLILPGFTMRVGDLLAYLEKQKESLHIPETCKENADSFTDEDEKIRKEIIHYIINYKADNVSEEQEHAWLEWLEKQKEQKPNYCHYGGDPSIERCKYCSATCSARLTEEQKPVEWSDEDEKIRRFLIDLLSACAWRKDWPFGPIEVITWLEKQGENKQYEAHNWPVDKDNLTQEQKPVECIEDSVKFDEGFKTGRESGLRDGQKYVLDNAESYGLCKPVEWSEEDEEIREEVIGDLCALKDWIIKYDANWLANPALKNMDKRISWLKSLPSRQTRMEYKEQKKK